MTSTMHLVMGMETTITVQSPYTSQTKAVPFDYIDGMVGIMPVFKTKEQAEAYSKGRFEILTVLIDWERLEKTTKGG